MLILNAAAFKAKDYCQLAQRVEDLLKMRKYHLYILTFRMLSNY